LGRRDGCHARAAPEPLGIGAAGRVPRQSRARTPGSWGGGDGCHARAALEPLGIGAAGRVPRQSHARATGHRGGETSATPEPLGLGTCGRARQNPLPGGRGDGDSGVSVRSDRRRASCASHSGTAPLATIHCTSPRDGDRAADGADSLAVVALVMAPTGAMCPTQATGRRRSGPEDPSSVSARIGLGPRWCTDMRSFISRISYAGHRDRSCSHEGDLTGCGEDDQRKYTSVMSGRKWPSSWLTISRASL